jgi:hypothetical protein
MENIPDKIEAYLRDKMTDPERIAFESEMRNDTGFQTAAISYLLDEKNNADPEEAELRRLLSKVRTEAGPMSMPELDWVDQIRFFLYSIRFSFLIFGSILLITAILLVRNWPTPLDKLIDQAFIRPYCEDRAGELTPDLNLKHKASYLFCGITAGGSDGIAALAGRADSFNIANFYLAHAYLDRDDYVSAVAEFEKCRQNVPYLKLYDEKGYQEVIELNLLLSKLGNGGTTEDILPELMLFVEKNPGNDSAKNLLNALKNPLRLLFDS